MKGLLLKEFYIWLRTRSWIMIYAVLLCVLSLFSTSSGISILPLALVMGMIANSFLLDEKSNWQSYSKALPCTPFERVSAKYIIHFSETVLCTAAYILTSVIASDKLDIAGIFVSQSITQTVGKYALVAAASFFSLSFLLSVSVKFKGTLRTAISLIVSLPFFLFLAFNSILSYRNLITFISGHKLYPAVIVALSIVALAASLMISVTAETNSDGDYKKKFRKAAIILTVITVLSVSVTGVAICIRYNNLDVDKTGNYDSISDYDSVASEINDYYNTFCNKIHIGTDFEEFASELVAAGFIRDDNRKDFFTSQSGNISIDLGVSYPEGKNISIVTVDCKNATKVFERATYESLTNIKLCFNEGISQTELYEKFGELEIIPCKITEQIFNGTDWVRRYTFEFIALEFEDEESSVSYTLTVDTEDEKVTGVDDLMRFVRDQTPVATEPSETPAEIAAREIKEYADNFCGESNITKTPRKFIKELRIAGFSESENTYDYFGSPDRKVSVAIDTDEDDNIRNITVIAHFGKTRTVDSAEKLDKFATEIPVGTDEKALIEKLEEMNALPDSIIENHTDTKEQRRVYEIKYIIEDSDGNSSCSVTIETVNGKVTDVLVF